MPGNTYVVMTPFSAAGIGILGAALMWLVIEVIDCIRERSS